MRRTGDAAVRVSGGVSCVVDCRAFVMAGRTHVGKALTPDALLPWWRPQYTDRTIDMQHQECWGGWLGAWLDGSASLHSALYSERTQSKAASESSGAAVAALAHFASHHCGPSSIPGLGSGRMCEKFHHLLAVGRWFPPGTPVSSTRKLISSSSFHRLDMTLAVAEALTPNKPIN